MNVCKLHLWKNPRKKEHAVSSHKWSNAGHVRRLGKCISPVDYIWPGRALQYIYYRNNTLLHSVVMFLVFKHCTMALNTQIFLRYSMWLQGSQNNLGEKFVCRLKSNNESLFLSVDVIYYLTNWLSIFYFVALTCFPKDSEEIESVLFSLYTSQISWTTFKISRHECVVINVQ